MTSSHSATIENYIERVRNLVDPALEAYADLGRGCPDQLREAIRYSLLGPGKRLRPMLLLMSAEACGGKHADALPAACAVEMVHAYSLIHDDLPAMDDDDLRRGRPTCHKAFDEATAILAGDSLLAMAFEVLASELEPTDVAAQCCAILARAAGPTALVGGQADDLMGESFTGNLETLEFIHRRKTGAVMLAAIEMGAVIAKASAWQRIALEEYGQRIGLAFQIVDDLLDVRGDAGTMGKQVKKDSSHGKLTFPGVLGAEESERRARQLVAEACAALAPLGASAGSLEALAHFVVERNH